jgi:hypothetical protein
MRFGAGITTLLTLSFSASLAWGWGEHTHQQMTADALAPVKWLDQYQSLKVTPFQQMLRDVAGTATPVGSKAFNFGKAKVRKDKHQKYMQSTDAMGDPSVQQFARHLLLINQLSFNYNLGERGKAVSARQILSRYAAEPDWGMDKGLDASKHQGLMGGTNPNKTSSQGFRHMSFLLGSMGEAPKRAQLFFDMGAKAIKKGHPYWGFRFVAWGMHYLEDMGTPVHTNMLPTLKYVRLKGMRPKDASGKRPGIKKTLGNVVAGSTQINSNYHFLYEDYVNDHYKANGKAAKALSVALKGRGTKQGKVKGFFSKLFAPKSVKSVAKRRAWSRLSTPSIARNAVRFFTEKFRKPERGAPSNTVRAVDDTTAASIVRTIDRPLAREGRSTYARRVRAGDRMMRSTTRQFRKNGVALRQAINILGKQIGRRK